jgi:hypothetical protein
MPDLPVDAPEFDLTPAQRELVRGLPTAFAIDRIDHIWIFPPFTNRKRETGFIVLSLLSPTEGREDNREVVTIRYEAGLSGGRTGYQQRVTEEGWAPAERIDRVIAGVLARSGSTSAEPISEQIGADQSNWEGFLERLAVT